MRPVTVWFNKSLSSTYNLIETLRAAAASFSPRPWGEGSEVRGLRILCTHTSPDFPAFRISDASEVEPRGPTTDAYLDFCLDFVRKNGVDVFFLGKMQRQIVRARQRFENLGVRLVNAAEADVLDLLESKSALYASIPAGLAPVPDYRVVNTLAEFDEAHAWLCGRQRTVCFKPAVSMFGLGFRILSERGTALDRLLYGSALKIGLPETRQFLGQLPRFRDLVVMQYLPGPERSVDCLARHGTLACCVVRRKPMGTEGGQLLEDNPAIEELARRLTAHFRLNGIFNIQFRDCDGTPFLLEINPRPSGGLHYACLSGVAVPYWAVCLALGSARPEDVPRPRTGLRVGQVNKAILL
ncbi:MAG: ATP-grasp domain-containing protein [Gemmataceae bacterium]|nr:ATP-grasp domain-containing protein [Gemmataceae bacterium]